MVPANMRYARLNKDQISKLLELEKEIGKTIIAYEPVEPIAKLDEEQLKRIKEVEKELGIILVGYKSNKGA